MAYEVRAAQGLTRQREDVPQGVTASIKGLESQLSLLSNARRTLEDILGALAGLARRLGYEESQMRQVLEATHAQHLQNEELQRDLIQTRQRLSVRESEIEHLRLVIRERDTLEQAEHHTSSPLTASPAALLVPCQQAGDQQEKAELNADEVFAQAEQFGGDPRAAVAVPSATVATKLVDESQQLAPESESESTDNSGFPQMASSTREELVVSTTTSTVEATWKPIPTKQPTSPTALQGSPVPPSALPATEAARSGQRASPGRSPAESVPRRSPLPPSSASETAEQKRRQVEKYDLFGPIYYKRPKG